MSAVLSESMEGFVPNRAEEVNRNKLPLSSGSLEWSFTALYPMPYSSSTAPQLLPRPEI